MSDRATRSNTWQQERARIAGMSSRPNRPPDDPELVEARRNLRALKLEGHIRKVLDGSSPLTGLPRVQLTRGV